MKTPALIEASGGPPPAEPARGLVTVRVQRRFLSSEWAVHQAWSHHSLSELIDAYASDLPPALLRVYIDDVPVPVQPPGLAFDLDDPDAWSPWDRVRARAGHEVVIQLVPAGGGNDLAMQIGISVLLLGAVVATGGLLGPAGLGLAPWAAALAAGAVGIGGAVAMGMLFQPEQPKSYSQRASYSITGTSNELAQIGQVIPWPCGEVGGVYPLHVAEPYVTTEDGEQYLHALLSGGIGPLRWSDIKIGDTPLADFPDLQYETREGRSSDADPTLYPRVVHESAPNIEVTHSDGPVTAQIVESGAMRLRFELTWAQGLYRFSESGKRRPNSVDVRIRYRALPSGGWTTLFSGSVEAEKQEVYRKSWWADVSANAAGWEGEVTRTNGDDNESRLHSQFWWTAFQGRTFEHPVRRSDMSLLALRVKASQQTQGLLQRISATLTRYALTRTGGAWVEQPSAQPAAMFRAVCQHRSANRNEYIPDRRLNLTSLETWAATTTSNNWRIGVVFADESTMVERLRLIAQAGRADYSTIDGKHGVVEDKQLPGGPVQYVTDHNSRGMALVTQYRRQAHALRVRFIDDDQGSVSQETLVYASGYNATGTGGKTAATVFDDLDLTQRGIRHQGHALAEGAYVLAQQILRPWTVTVEMDQNEAALCQHGERVRFAHPSALYGISASRLAVVEKSGSNVTGVWLDGPVTMLAGNSYGVNVRSVATDGSNQHAQVSVTNTVSTTRHLTFATTSSANMQVGDLAIFGLSSKIAADCLVRSVQPSGGRTATVELVPYAQPDIDDAVSGAIADYDPGITQPQGRPKPPPAPVLIGVRRDHLILPREPLGTQRKVQLMAVISAPPAKGTAAEYYQVAYRVSGETTWKMSTAPAGDTELPFVVPWGEIYQVRVRAAATSAGVLLTSDWSNIKTVDAKTIEQTVIDVATVTGLELQGQGHDTEFTGRDAHLVWRMTSLAGAAEIGDEAAEGDETFRDPTFSHWLVTVYSDDVPFEERRTERVTQPEYLYSYGKNWDDAKLLSPSTPSQALARQFTVRIWIVDTYGRRSLTPAQITVQNSAPAQATGLDVTTNIGTIWVSFNFPIDPDWVGMKVWASTTSGFAIGDGVNLLGKVNGNIASFNTFQAGGAPVLPGADYYVRVALFDAFGDQNLLLNISAEIHVRTASIDITDLPEFVFDPAPDYSVAIGGGAAGADRISWTAAAVHVVHPASGTRADYTIAPGFADWTGLTVYVSYQEQATALVASTDPTLHTFPDRTLMARWSGGLEVEAFNGQAGIDGAFIYGQTITANALAAGEIITQTAQIRAGIITNAHITDLDAGKLIADSILAQRIFVQRADKGRIVLDGAGGDGFVPPQIRVYDDAGRRRLQIGRVGTGSGDFGLNLWDADGGVVFSADSLHGTYIKDLTVGTAKITDDAISRSASATGGSWSTSTGNAVSVTINCLPASRVLLFISCDQVQAVSGNVSASTMTLYRSNVSIASRGVGAFGSPSATLTWYRTDNSPGTGNVTYRVGVDFGLPTSGNAMHIMALNLAK